MSNIVGRHEILTRMLKFLKEEKFLSKTTLLSSSGREYNYAKKYFKILLDNELIEPVEWFSNTKKKHINYKISNKGINYVYHFNKINSIVSFHVINEKGIIKT
ncbi:MAG: winged helix-turn-helix domain-containing protein [Candidatus Hodarchaeota archaeon]